MAVPCGLAPMLEAAKQRRRVAEAEYRRPDSPPAVDCGVFSRAMVASCLQVFFHFTSHPRRWPFRRRPARGNRCGEHRGGLPGTTGRDFRRKMPPGRFFLTGGGEPAPCYCRIFPGTSGQFARVHGDPKRPVRKGVMHLWQHPMQQMPTVGPAFANRTTCPGTPPCAPASGAVLGWRPRSPSPGAAPGHGANAYWNTPAKRMVREYPRRAP